ncbi:hypothetical protein F4778DRAFT_399855 [Xylariomycetidae sp. FL2044]|nr:hypothetical protein F4778DRAFT_399855 [Xylariomycetidae sp. FL2044]
MADPFDSFSNSTTSGPTASQVTVVHLPRLDDSHLRPHLQQDLPTPSSQPTVIPYAPTPPPAPTVLSDLSRSGVYTPHQLRPLFPPQPLIIDDYDLSPQILGLESHFHQPAFQVLPHQQDPSLARDFKDDLARAASMVTPGVDEVPYIRYALDALSRKPHDGWRVSHMPSRSSDASGIPEAHLIVNPGPLVLHPPAAHIPSGGAHSRPLSAPPVSPQQDLQARRSRREGDTESDEAYSSLYRPESRDYFLEHLEASRQMRMPTDPIIPEKRTPPRTLEYWKAQGDKHVDPEVGEQEFPALTAKPWILRSQSLLLLASLCGLTITALVFCAIYSIGRNGFTPYEGTIYGGQYFVFRILPQLLSAALLLYAQSAISVAFRILPFSLMASHDRRERRNAVFAPLYPKSFLWPQLVGTWGVWVPILNVWLMNLTIPLSSGLFTVVLVDGSWRWSTVQSVAWTLVALYVSLLLSILVMVVYWRRRRTGLMDKWHHRTLADIIYLVSQSNSLAQYHGLETMPTLREMKQTLDGTAERLGYWCTPEEPTNFTFYGIGVPTAEEDPGTEKSAHAPWAQRRGSGQSLVSGNTNGRRGGQDVRSRYLPWCFRNSQVVLSAVGAVTLLVALVVVSFVRSTDVRSGFLPQLSADPTPGAFSPADFLYSFVPSLLGLVLYLLFHSLDLTLRVLTPWGELARKEGARAETSLLLDYAACLPWESTYKAIRNKHWRVAFISLLAPLFILLPVLGGGLFLALTPSSGIVRMYPHVPVFAILLTLLFLYAAALVSLIPQRKQFRLPHAVTCLAEVISFCCNEQLRTDKAFDFDRVGNHHDLCAQLDAGRDWHRQGRWTFGRGPHDDERLGIKRCRKYTVNRQKLGSYDRRVRGHPISSPLPRGSGSLFSR